MWYYFTRYQKITMKYNDQKKLPNKKIILMNIMWYYFIKYRKIPMKYNDKKKNLLELSKDEKSSTIPCHFIKIMMLENSCEF